MHSIKYSKSVYYIILYLVAHEFRIFPYNFIDSTGIVLLFSLSSRYLSFINIIYSISQFFIGYRLLNLEVTCFHVTKVNPILIFSQYVRWSKNNIVSVKIRQLEYFWHPRFQNIPCSHLFFFFESQQDFLLRTLVYTAINTV